MPQLQLKNLQGAQESLMDYRGKIVVLNFWATWCVPCREEMPLFDELQDEYGDSGVQFIAASLDDPAEQAEVEKFVRKYSIDFPIWMEATSEQQASFRLATSIPATVILDGDGRPRFRIIGKANHEVMTERLEWLLSDGSHPPPPELVLPPGITPEHFREHELGLEDEHEHEEEVEASGSEVPS